MSRPSGRLVARGLEVTLGGASVLRGVDFEAEPGLVTAVVGPSGGGKSTLLRCLNRLIVPDRGEVSLDGDPLPATGARLAALRARIGFVFQSFNLFPHLDALGNVALGPRQVLHLGREVAEERAVAALRRVGLGDRLRHRPSELSGGQQQRVAIARALAMDPAVVLCDEPTSSLDRERAEEVLDVLRQLAAEGRTMVLVTHELRFARAVAQRLAFMEAGRIESAGPIEEVLASPGQDRLRQFFGEAL